MLILMSLATFLYTVRICEILRQFLSRIVIVLGAWRSFPKLLKYMSYIDDDDDFESVNHMEYCQEVEDLVLCIIVVHQLLLRHQINTPVKAPKILCI